MLHRLEVLGKSVLGAAYTAHTPVSSLRSFAAAAVVLTAGTLLTAPGLGLQSAETKAPRVPVAVGTFDQTVAVDHASEAALPPEVQAQLVRPSRADFPGVQELPDRAAEIRDVARSRSGRIAVAAADGLFLSAPSGNGWSELRPGTDGPQHRSWQPRDVRAVVFDSRDRLWFASPQGLGVYDLDRDHWQLFTGEDGLPWADATSLAAGTSGDIWLGTTRGLVHFDGSTWEYRQGRRYLPDDRVERVAVDSYGSVFAATPAGIGELRRIGLTLAQKAQWFEQRIDRFHRRTPYEYVDGVYLATPGDTSELTQRSSDNDGLWTAMYGAGECYAWAATGDPKARQRARKAFEALRFLSDVTQGGSHPAPPGFPARSILPTSGPDPNIGLAQRDRERQRNRDRSWKLLQPRWPVSADGRWYWKTDTSSDELDGHYFFYALYYDLVADTEQERAEVAEVIRRVTDHLLEHDFALVDHDGKKTRWAQFGPAQLNQDPNWWEERGLNSLSVLSYLRVAEHATGDARYGRVAQELIDEHDYAANVRNPKVQTGPGTGNQSDDEMAFMGFYHLLRYEHDPQLRSIWAHSFHRYWLLVQPERNPLFNFLYAAVMPGLEYEDAFESGELMSGEPDWLLDSVDTLKRFPLDRVDWRLDHRHRLDIVELRPSARDRARGHLRDGRVLPIDERHVGHWNHDPWALVQGGEGRRLSDGAAFLLPYYLGLHHGFLALDDGEPPPAGLIPD